MREGDDDRETGPLPLVRIRRRHGRIPVTGGTDCEACETSQLRLDGRRFLQLFFSCDFHYDVGGGDDERSEAMTSDLGFLSTQETHNSVDSGGAAAAACDMAYDKEGIPHATPHRFYSRY